MTLCAGVWLVGLPPISKSLNLQGFFSKKSRSVAAFRYTKVVHHTRKAAFTFAFFKALLHPPHFLHSPISVLWHVCTSSRCWPRLTNYFALSAS
ncbi:hypothetical protein EMIT0P43_10439 [Pseudomonas jessenii]